MILIPSFLAYLSLADGYSDPYYLRFKKREFQSLILGTSRAAQGIQPSEINRILGREDVYNYSFSISHSPYGELYKHSILSRLSDNSQDQIFILSLDPWSISENTNRPRREFDGPLNQPTLSQPWLGLNYLLFHFQGHLGNILLMKFIKPMFLHEDGWLEVMIPMDSASIEKRTLSKIQTYREENLPNYFISPKRMSSLEGLIISLQEKGSVFLVILPVESRIHEIDLQLDPDFSDRAQEISIKLNAPLLDFSNQGKRFVYTDGNHLSPASGKKVSKIIADWIQDN